MKNRLIIIKAVLILQNMGYTVTGNESLEMVAQIVYRATGIKPHGDLTEWLEAFTQLPVDGIEWDRVERASPRSAIQFIDYQPPRELLIAAARSTIQTTLISMSSNVRENIFLEGVR